MPDISKLIDEALAIEEEDAKAAGALGFMGRALVQATLPHSKTSGNEFKRINGNYRLSMLAPKEIGLPYGTIPRLLLIWLSTEAIKTKSPEIILGKTLSGFMDDLGMISAGGKNGPITKLKDQMTRLFSSFITCAYVGEHTSIQNASIIDAAELWWNPKSPSQSSLWKSSVTLSHSFFREVTENPVPIDLRAVNALRRSPLAIDIYCWLTHRLGYLKHESKIPWQLLQLQMGAAYSNSPQGTRDFKRAFLRALNKVQLVYPAAKADDRGEYLLLRRSQTSIPKLYDLRDFRG